MDPGFAKDSSVFWAVARERVKVSDVTGQNVFGNGATPRVDSKLRNRQWLGASPLVPQCHEREPFFYKGRFSLVFNAVKTQKALFPPLSLQLLTTQAFTPSPVPATQEGGRKKLSLSPAEGLGGIEVERAVHSAITSTRCVTTRMIQKLPRALGVPASGKNNSVKGLSFSLAPKRSGKRQRRTGAPALPS
ncbi:MAG: hypothetical protein ACK42L_03650 [Thermoanaerobaculum sp.]